VDLLQRENNELKELMNKAENLKNENLIDKSSQQKSSIKKERSIIKSQKKDTDFEKEDLEGVSEWARERLKKNIE